MEGILFIVATPIGNLDDITLRAIKTLEKADLIACEDTRHTKGLLSHLGIQKPLLSYHMHNEREATEKIISNIEKGLNVALVSDAGTPCISDPGAKLVNAVREKGLNVTVIPGASAVISAYALSGLEYNGFTFLGFLQGKVKEKEKILRLYEKANSPLIFYSAPHDIKKDLLFFAHILGNRKVTVIKEITKIFETVYQGNLEDIIIENTKGEFVVIIEPDLREKKINEEEIVKELDKLINLGMSRKDATSEVAEIFNLSKKEVYSLAFANFSH